MENELLKNVYVTYSTKYFYAIASKLKYAPLMPITPPQLIRHLAADSQTGKTLAIIVLPEGADPEKMDPLDIVGCAVITLINTAEGESFWIDYVWSTSKKITFAMQEYVEEIARARGIETIAGYIRRGYKAIEKRYNYKEESRLYKKKITFKEE